ncbi:MAG TPA: type II toxin-antitoxin system VapC family toxin [Candidatus Acidoferrales bacterium]|nr:type II toxin-antitoxin system VapC family toxin [Candidatus Acidoferrales bacterium]
MACLDTSVIIEFLHSNDIVTRLVSQYQQTEPISTTSVTEYELLKYQNPREAEVSRELLESLEIHAFDRSAALESSKMFMELKKKGTPISDTDILIAGIAASRNETLITMDKDFERLGYNKIVVVGRE